MCCQLNRSQVLSMHTYTFQPHIKDDWERFREAANGVGHEWETWSIEMGGSRGIEGSYALPKIFDLA